MLKIETTDYTRNVIVHGLEDFPDGLEILIHYTGENSGRKAVPLDGIVIPEIIRRFNAENDLWSKDKDFRIPKIKKLNYAGIRSF